MKIGCERLGVSVFASSSWSILIETLKPTPMAVVIAIASNKVATKKKSSASSPRAKQLQRNAKNTSASSTQRVRSSGIDLSDIPETDFSAPNAVRGKYADRFQPKGYVRLDDDIAEAFSDAVTVNMLLREALKKRQP